jgi:uncharacterized protein (AIM24 family)
MSRYSVQEFITKTAQQDKGQGLFELESERILELNLNGMAWIKKGSMVAYRGNVRFTREAVLQQGLGAALKKAVTGEGAQLTKAEGQGKVYLADGGKKIFIIDISGASLFVNGSDLLAMQDTVQYQVKMMKRVTAIVAGGLFNVLVQGNGLVAITSHYEPITLTVEPGNPVFTDPNATIAWSGNLMPEMKTDVSLKTFLGRGSGESVQMKFDGHGFVVVQPYEELPLQATPTAAG